MVAKTFCAEQNIDENMHADAWVCVGLSRVGKFYYTKSRIESNSQSINWSDSKNQIFNDNYLYFGTTEM